MKMAFRAFFIIFIGYLAFVSAEHSKKCTSSLFCGKEIVTSPADPQVENDNDFFSLSTATSKMSLVLSSSSKISLRLVNIYFLRNKLYIRMGPKKQGFWPRINCSQMKLPNFGSPFGDSLSKFGCHFSNKAV